MKPTLVRVAVAGVLMMAVMSLGRGVPGILADGDDDDDDDDGGRGVRFVYAAKALCPPTAVTTTINVHNPNEKAVTFIKKGIALDSGQNPTPPSGRTRETLKPDWALQMSCDDIAALGAVGVGGFGDVIIESSGELDVWAVYLTGASDGPGPGPTQGGTVVDTDVVRVPPTAVKSTTGKK